MQSIDTSRVSPIAPEDVARAQWYGLIARLFSAPLSISEHQQLSEVTFPADHEASELDSAFCALCESAK